MNSLTIYENGKFDLMQRTAGAMVESGYFKDSKDIAQAIVKVMAGAELGLPPFASMTGINIIQGKPALGANVIATLVKNDPRYNYKIKTCNDTECILEWYENGERCGESSFTFEEAKRAGLSGKDNWKKYPSDMMFARAVSRGSRRFAPGIFGGAPVYTPDELGVDVDAEGYVEAHTIQDDMNQDVYEEDFSQDAEVVDSEVVEVQDAPDSQAADLRAALESAEQPTLGLIANYAVGAKKFKSPQEALKKIGDYSFPDGVEIKMSQKVSNSGAVKVFDWLLGE